MTRVGYDFSVKKQNEAASTDVLFSSRGFRSLNVGPKNKDLEVKVDPKIITMKEAVARETAVLMEQQKRLSVRDLTIKFERGVAAAAKLSSEAKLRETASLEKHVLLKNLRESLESLKGRVEGRNKDDVDEAISLVTTLVAQLNQRERDLIQEKNEVTALLNLLKQASENAKEFVDEERAFARAEIEKAREAVQRIEEAIQEHERISSAFEKQDLDELMNDVHEARRIKMLHEPSKVMDMELEIRALRAQLLETSQKSLLLQKELTLSRRREGASSNLYQIDGPEVLGSYLEVHCCSDQAPEMCSCSVQWYRLCTEGMREIISGATKPIYAAEPFDVGKILQVDILSNGHLTSLTSAGPIDPAPGLGSYVDALAQRHDNEFNVVITQMNGLDHSSESIHILHVGKMRMKLCKGQGTIAKEYYSSAMLLCGVRGGGNAAAQALFWQARKGLNFVLAFESERERNAAIMLARRFAIDTNVVLCGPDDRSPWNLATYHQLFANAGLLMAPIS